MAIEHNGIIYDHRMDDGKADYYWNDETETGIQRTFYDDAEIITPWDGR